jgi:thiamine pyrophosphate-dependent acetolactate synthase large subunit-like protein
MDMLKKPVDVAEYLFTRLHQIGVRSVHGLPGDYNLVALDYLPAAKLEWVGSVNELNAGEFPRYLFFLSECCTVTYTTSSCYTVYHASYDYHVMYWFHRSAS